MVNAGYPEGVSEPQPWRKESLYAGTNYDHRLELVKEPRYIGGQLFKITILLTNGTGNGNDFLTADGFFCRLRNKIADHRDYYDRRSSPDTDIWVN